MKTGFPKFPDEYYASSIFEWLFEVKARELGLDQALATAKEVKAFRDFWSLEAAPKVWDAIGCLQRSESPWDSMSDMLHLWAACGLDKVVRCKRTACGRFFFSSKQNQKYCDPKCREQDREQRYDTATYREEKKQAMRRRRAAIKALRNAKLKALRASAKAK
jgi:hypothetical protein